MKDYTTEERAEFTRRSQKEFNGKTLDILIGPPIDVLLVVAPLDRVSFAKLEDDCLRGNQVAYRNLLMERTLAPDLLTLHELTGEWATLPEKAHKGFQDEAGAGEWAAVVRLDPERPPPGLSKDEAQKMIAASARRLWAVTSEKHGLSCVMETPLSDVWMAARGAYEDALVARSGTVAAIDLYVLPAVTWSSEALTGGAGLLDRKPLLIKDLQKAYRTMGGDAASVRTKSVQAGS